MKNNNLRENAKAIKKRITRNAIVIGFLVFVFITALTFTMSAKQVASAFQSKFNQAMWAIRSWDAAFTSFDETAMSFGMMMGYYDEGEYPVALGFYSLDGELKYTSGSVIDVNTNDGRFTTLNIDKYMTEEIQREVKKFLDHKNKNELRLSNFKYYKDGEEIIPVELTFEILKEGEPVVVDGVFDYEHLVVWSKTVTLSDKSPARSGDVYGFYFVNKTSGKNGRITKDLFDSLAENTEPGVLIVNGMRLSYVPEGENLWGAVYSNIASEMDPRMGFTDKDRGYLVTNPVELNGEIGYYIVASGQNLYREALENKSFIYMEILSLIAIALASWIIGRSLIKTALRNMEMDESKHAFMSATAHELKTPIAIIQNQAEMILENISPEKNQSYIESIYEESKRMDSIVRTMQQYDRMRSDGALTKSKFDLSRVARSEVSKYSNAIQEKGIQLDLDIPESCITDGDENLIALVIDNYLSNAWKYTEPGGTISIKLEEKSSNEASPKVATLSVFNTCTPLSEKDLKNVWIAMYKGDSSRTRASEQLAESGGMGLAVCKRILELHGFSYGCTNQANGVKFYFRTDNP